MLRQVGKTLRTVCVRRNGPSQRRYRDLERGKEGVTVRETVNLEVLQCGKGGTNTVSIL